ncbi:contractile injection system protein, VgrG/Pvc8 family [uncultured Leptotrichia sp.]|uniref:contractile injection system protein, VgrG/Pvc8 family n=1 Tax=uncultured Leptotrichia sp. TaxID=159271 RepID=UPI00262AC168|nr:contractile injection system protein, VgrG/Pvc8 family [uncultured Leptotrichia sp.]
MSKDVNVENMYEGKNIGIILNKTKLENFVIQEFVLDENINEHQKLEIQLEMDDEQRKNLERIIEKEDVGIEIELANVDKDVKRRVFSGIVDYFEILDYGSYGCRILMRAFSKSVLFDRKNEKKYRVFQDRNLMFSDIIDEINKDYADKKLEIKYSDIAKKQIGSLIVQFDETDWEFLVRLASQLKTGMFVIEQGIILFGMVEMGEIKKENKYFSDYSLVRDYKNLYYKVQSNKVINLGDTVSISENAVENEENDKDSSGNKGNFSVLKTRIFLKDFILKSEFLATDMKSYHIFKKYNEKIKGCRIEANVERVFEDGGIAKMEVRFAEGLKKIVQERSNEESNDKAYDDYGIKRFPLSYQTFYSQTNTGFFCTPEVNDTVEVYFPNEDERFAKVSWAINNKGNGRFSDYTKRNFQVNQSDFNFSLNLNTFEVKMAEKYSVESPNIVENADNFVNKANQNMIVASNNYLGIESIGDADFYGSKINIIGKEKEITMESLSSDVRIKGKKVHSN